MQIRPSSALRNEYTQISELAKASGEPIFITNKGEDDGVYMSMAAYEEREKMFRHRDKIYGKPPPRWATAFHVEYFVLHLTAALT